MRCTVATFLLNDTSKSGASSSSRSWWMLLYCVAACHDMSCGDITTDTVALKMSSAVRKNRVTMLLLMPIIVVEISIICYSPSCFALHVSMYMLVCAYECIYTWQVHMCIYICMYVCMYIYVVCMYMITSAQAV